MRQVRWKQYLLLMLCLAGLGVQAEYDEYCYKTAVKLAKDPSSLKLGEIDGLKSCLQELQRAGVVQQVQPAGAAEADLVCPAPDLKKLCPVCPKPDLDKLCPAWVQNKEERERAEWEAQKRNDPDRNRLKPHIPGY